MPGALAPEIYFSGIIGSGSFIWVWFLLHRVGCQVKNNKIETERERERERDRETLGTQRKKEREAERQS